jgi:hypothetical protein
MPNTCHYDRAGLGALLPTQYGVIARWQALGCGLTPKAIDYRLRPGGPWRAMLPGVYLTMTGTPTVEQRDMAALLYAGSHSVITGAVAVRRHHLSCAGLDVIDVLIPADVRRRSTGFVRIQRTTRMPEKVYQAGPIRFAAPHRAVADAARTMARFSDVQAVVCAALQRKRCALPLLVEELNEGPSAGSRSLRRALAEVSDGVRSAAEADLKKLIDQSDLEKPLYNARLYTPDGDFIAKPDAWWQRAGVAGEVDSREYHMEAADYRATQMRHNRMESYGINVQHWLPRVISTESRTVLADLRRAIAAGHARPLLPIVTMVDG